VFLAVHTAPATCLGKGSGSKAGTKEKSRSTLFQGAPGCVAFPALYGLAWNV